MPIMTTETTEINLPSPVLTKRHSKSWNESHFALYEKELKKQINAMHKKVEIDCILRTCLAVQRAFEQPQKTYQKPRTSHHKRRSTLTMNNSGEWSRVEMDHYVKGLKHAKYKTQEKKNGEKKLKTNNTTKKKKK
eukprot:592090_1